MEVFIIFLLIIIGLSYANRTIKVRRNIMPVGGVMPNTGNVCRPSRVRYNIRLTMKAIIRTEQMLSKPFVNIDYTNQDELLKLLYCCILANNPITFTYEEFQAISENETQLSSMLKEIEKANFVLAQFSGQREKAENAGTGDAQYIKDLAGTLIMSGIDAGYVMNEMELSDMPVYIEAYEKRKREEMEASRLWTFLTIAPHIDTSKVKSAKDLMLFPWEEDETKKKAEEALIKDTELAERFFKGEFNPFKNN